MLDTSRDDLCKQFESRWDAAERGISSGSKQFAIETILQKENIEISEFLKILADDILQQVRNSAF